MRRHNDRREISGLIEEALTAFEKDDRSLLHINAHERTIAHRLAIHIENLVKKWNCVKKLNVDCEYNRNLNQPKMRKGGRKIVPDIIIHHRDTTYNALFLEIKKSSRSADAIELDKKRACEVTTDWSEKIPRYCHAVVIVFPVRAKDDGVVYCTWFHRRGCGSLIGPRPDRREVEFCFG